MDAFGGEYSPPQRILVITETPVNQKRKESGARITPSILDRLVDLEPDSLQESRSSFGSSIRELKHAVRRDLEWLLNTRRGPINIDPNLEEVPRSIAVYGLPDFMGAAASTVAQQQNLAAQVRETIKIFAPQLIDVKVSYSPPDKIERSIAFRIEAKIDVEPVPEPIVFDTVLQLGSGEFGVKEA